ncbi:major capsid protein [uncultured Acetatifactor sp.]|uniref:major capsid protein n=1 Tax=uncultured Acetatifactor sp. TaxID=1671927 RepID=UPI00262CAB46|nr:major capsid protein [uncultured Acetatifactor sp.]
MAEYTTREMVEAIEIAPPVRNFLTRTFFPRERTHRTEKVEFDIRKGKRIMAPFVSPRIGGKVITRNGFQTYDFTTPRLAPERVMTVDDISKRGLGENVYSKKTPSEREDDLLADDLKDLDESIQRRLEWMCRQILFEGKLDVVDAEAGVDFQVDYGFENIFVLTSERYWSLSTVNPVPLLKEKRRKIIKDTGKAPNVMIFASDLIEVFLDNPFIKEAMDIRNLQNIEMKPRIVDDALTYYGKIAELGLEIYSYEEFFLNDDGEEEGIIPSGSCIMAHSEGEGSIEYGLITQMEDKKYQSYEAKQVPKVYCNENSDVKMLRLTSRPLPRPENVEGWCVIYPNGMGA